MGDGEQEELLVVRGPPSSDVPRMIILWMLIAAVLFFGLAFFGVMVSWHLLMPMSPQDVETKKLADVVLQLVHDEKLKQEALQVEGDAVWEKDLHADGEKIMDLLRSMETKLSPEAAAKLGVEVTATDLARIFGVTSAHGHPMSLEDVKRGAFQGDMMPKDFAQLERFVSHADDARVMKRLAKKKRRRLTSGERNFGAGEPWTGGVVNYCFQENIASGAQKAIRFAIKQYKKAVPCLQFVDVGLGPSGKSCMQSPAILVTSEKDGCWSYVGMLRDEEVQQLNLETPGCDSVGTAMHELGHALGMEHEQSRPDRDEYVKIYSHRIEDGNADQFTKSENGDMERPYDLMSLMHYESDAFSKNGKPTIVAKDKAYELYTSNPSQFHRYKMGNRVGLTQMDADQVADLYRAENGLCVSHLLSKVGEDAPCSDLQKDGKKWLDEYGQECKDYVQMEADGQIDDCGEYSAGDYCCDCGGGLRLQEWSWECDLCKTFSAGGCSCKTGPWSVFNHTSLTTCGNPGYLNHFAMCRVPDSCHRSSLLGGLRVAPCAPYTGLTDEGCRCLRRKRWNYHGQEVLGTCGNPDGKTKAWCFVVDPEECEGKTWGYCEEAKVDWHITNV